ncbi:hypothetical protein [Arthrobacter sp. MAHUQ-56]
MHIYSKWIVTTGNPDYLEVFAEGVGEVGVDKVNLGDGRVILREMRYEDPRESSWAESVTSGRWSIGLVDVELHDGMDSRLVGVVTPSASLTAHLFADLADMFKAEEPAVFSLRRVLESGQLHPFSVRLTDDTTRVLVQSRDTKALLETVSALPGEPMGVTVTINQSQISISNQGEVIFADSTSPTIVAASIRLIAQESALVPDWA